ncbi:MAG: sugar transferase [Acidobacteriota bacterium]
MSVRQAGLPLLAKRPADLLAVAVLAGPALLILGVLGLLVRVDSPGPAIFRQQRLGRDRRPFTCYKLRTMDHGAPDAPHRAFIAELMGPDADTEPGADGLFKLAGDRRVTRLGRFLRTSSLDELPQLLNVLRGEMSLVGPRPVVAYEVEHYLPRDLERFNVLPGLTGLWQVSGRSRRSYREMLDLDVDYARRWSPALDVRVLLATVGTLLRSAGQAR